MFHSLQKKCRTITFVAGIAASVIMGLVVGVCFILILAVALHPNLVVRDTTFVDVTSLPMNQQQAVEKAKESKTFQLFQVKNPFVYLRSVSNETINNYDKEGNVIDSEQVVQVLFLGDTGKATFDIDAPTQVFITGMALYVKVDMEGEIRGLELRCLYSLIAPQASTGAASAVYGEEDIIKILSRNMC